MTAGGLANALIVLHQGADIRFVIGKVLESLWHGKEHCEFAVKAFRVPA
jgi:hypothetical protein